MTAEPRALPSWLREALARPAESRKTSIEGADIHYRCWAGGEGKPGLLFVHGYLGHSHWWDPIAPFFADAWRAAAIDLGGMGESGRRSHYSHDLAAREIVGVIEHGGLDPAVLVAHSYGGVPATLAAIARPDLVARLVFLDSRLPLPGIIPYRRRQATAYRVYPDFETAVAQFRLWPPGLWPDPHVLNHIATHSYASVPEGYALRADGGTGALFETDMPAIDGASITVPVDYVRGDCSEIVSAEQAALIVSQLADAQEPVVIPGCHHHLMIEQPVALIAALRAILSRSRQPDR